MRHTHCALGKMMDNGGSMRPVYIEAKDTEHKPAAKHAFKALFEQRVGHTDFAVEAAEVYELSLSTHLSVMYLPHQSPPCLPPRSPTSQIFLLSGHSSLP